MNLFPYNSQFNFMRLRKVSLLLALALMVVAVAAIPIRGFNFALDFTGGTVAELHFEKSVDLEAARETLDEAGFEGVQVQTFGATNEILIRLQPDEADTTAARTGDALLKALKSAENPGTLVRSDFVGPQIGKELAQNGVYALLLVVAGFLIYISLRFEWKFAVAAIITTLHDVVIAIGWFALSGHEFDLNVLAGILSVMGYSINDTIVVFDRVRENFRTLRLSPVEIMNLDQGKAVLFRQYLRTGEKVDPVGNAITHEEVGDGRNGKVRHDLDQGVDLVLAPNRAQFEEGESRVHRENHDGPQKDEKDI